jgi:hypothetical protein
MSSFLNVLRLYLLKNPDPIKAKPIKTSTPRNPLSKTTLRMAEKKNRNKERKRRRKEINREKRRAGVAG